MNDSSVASTEQALERRELLELLLMEEGLDASQLPIAPARRDAQFLPLSFAQQRLWFLDRLEPGSTAYIIPATLRIEERLVEAALERSLCALVQRHESLRTSFVLHEGSPVQVIGSADRLLIRWIDIQIEEHESQIEEVQRLLQQEAQQPFDLSRSPLLRATLLKLAPESYVLLLTMHHIISDGWSMQVLRHELTTLYQAFASGQTPSLPALPIQYADFAIWQRQCLQGEVLEAQLDYWIAQLSGVPPLELPIDHLRPAVQSRRGAIHSFVLSSDLLQSLQALSRQEGVTLFMTLLAAYQVLLYRYTGQKDIVLGTDSANRTRAEIAGIIGFFVNLLVLRTDLSGNLSFREVLSRIREVVLDAYAHQETPFELLVEKLVPAHHLDRMPLVQALFVLQNFTSPETTRRTMTNFTQQDSAPDLLKIEATTAKFDLVLFMQEQAGQLYGALNYSLDLFEASTIVTMAARFETILYSIVRHSDDLIDTLEFITDEERLQNKREEETIKSTLRLRKGRRFSLPG